MGRGSGGGGRSQGGGGGGVVSPAEMQALREYTNSDYQSINEYLSGRTSQEVDDFLSPKKLSPTEIRGKVALIDSALEKIPAYKGSVYRGIQVDIGSPGSAQEKAFQSFADTYPKGGTVSFKEYLSTSTRKQASFRGNIRYTIASKGKNGKDLRRLNPEEGEVLFSRGSKFKVKSITPRTQEVGPLNNRITRVVGYDIELTEA